MDNPNDFFGWLAVQPPFVEVALGAFFCLIVAPAGLTAEAIVVTALEAFAETRLTPLLASRRRGIIVSHFSRVAAPLSGQDALP